MSSREFNFATERLIDVFEFLGVRETLENRDLYVRLKRDIDKSREMEVKKLVWSELRTEGSLGSINTYDNQIVTWGKGFSFKGSVNEVFDELFVNLEMQSLFRLAPVVKELRLVKPYINLVRNEDLKYNFQDLIDQLDFFVTRFQFLILVKRLGGGRDVGQPVIDQREIVVNQRKVGFDLRGRFVMQARQRKVAGVIVKVREVVMRLNVARIVL